MCRLVLLALFSSLLFSSSLPLYFKGNEKIASRDLYDTLGLRLPYAIEVWEDNPVLESIAVSQSIIALSSYYRSRGYFDAKVSAQETNSSITLVIEENEPITIADIKINSILELDNALTLKTNALFDQENFTASKTNIKKRYGDHGYCNAQFNSKAWVDIQTHKAYLLFEATPNEPCTFGAISITPTPNIDKGLTASMLRFDEGDPYNLSAIQESYEALYAQEAIARVTINDNDREGNVVPITVAIEETEKPVRFTSGLGYSSDQGLGALAGVKHRNFFGNLKTLSLDARYSQIKQEASGILSIPLHNRASIHGEVGYSDERFEGYRDQSVFEKLTLKYQDIPSSALVGLLFDQTKTYESTNPQAFPNTNLFILSPLGEINIDTRDKPLDPKKGYWINAKAQGSLLSDYSDATYFKTLLSGAYLESVGEHIVGTRVKWGTLRTYEGQTPPSYRFYAGGMNSNRAYTYRELGPKDAQGDPLGFASLLEGTVEYRFPIYSALRGVLFSDLTFGSNNYIPDYSLPYWAVGTGLRYVTPIGPIAIDVAVDPDDSGQYALHFRIGELF
ncbi:MAG: translocation and assembly module TamA [Campylobacterota bacterium]|nr:translocation and assembly module TamA [Campylobacterota bacterium]